MTSGSLPKTLHALAGRAKRSFFGDPEKRPREAYAQEGEDLILERLLDGQPYGTYVDIGAHHPMRFSNTYLFYKRGWRGINVDAQPGSMAAFRRYRKRDINLELGVGLSTGSLPFYCFNEPALNTFDEGEAKRKAVPPYHLKVVVNIEVRRLDDILIEYLPLSEDITFLTTDVEGRDLEVLQSNDWVRFRPRFVLAETLRSDLITLAQSPIASYMAAVGYRPVAKAYNTTFFERE
jgi:FkbM family methyltransferase